MKRSSQQNKKTDPCYIEKQKKYKSFKTASGKSRKVFSKGFKKGFLIAWAAFAVILIAGMIVLWTKLNRYETGLPEHYIEQILKEISEGNLDSLHLVTADGISVDDDSLFVDKTLVQQFLNKKNAASGFRCGS